MATSVATQPTYLSLCTQNVQPETVTALEKKSTLWTVAAVVSTVAFFALAIGAFIAVGIFAEVYLPIAGISALVAGLMAASKVKDFVDWGDTAKLEADKVKEIQRHYADLTAQNRSNPANPVLAHAKYFEALTAQVMQDKEGLLDAERTQTEPVDLKGHFHLEALIKEDSALKAKLFNAFARAVAQNLRFAGTLETLGTIHNAKALEICLRERPDAVRDVLFKFKNRGISSFTYGELKTHSVDQLAQRIRLAMVVR